jgi:hypothetical protein
MAANIAMEILAPLTAISTRLQRLTRKLLPGNQILVIRRIILRRNQRRKSAPRKGRGIPRTGKIVALAADEASQASRCAANELNSCSSPSAALAARVSPRHCGSPSRRRLGTLVARTGEWLAGSASTRRRAALTTPCRESEQPAFLN